MIVAAIVLSDSLRLQKYRGLKIPRMNLNQVTLPTLNLDRAIGFYQSLGLELIVRANPHYARFLCPNGQSTCSLHLVEELPSGGGIQVYFECEDLDEKVEQLKKAGLVFSKDPTDQPWLWREAHLSDPDGNQLILFWAGEHRINPPWRLPSPAH